MSTKLSDSEIETVARRIVQLIGERLSTDLVAPAPLTVPAPAPITPQLAKLPKEAAARLAYTVKQLCSELSLSPATIYRLDSRGLLKSVPGIRTKLYSRTEVEKFLAGKQGGWK